MSDKSSRRFNIQLAAEMSGLSTHTIRAWEKRYEAVTPERSDNGRRLYSTEEIERLILLAQLTQFGSNISQVAHLPDDELKALHQKIIQHSDQFKSSSVFIKDVDIQETKKSLLDAVGKYQVEVISQLLSRARMALPPKVFALDILCPLIEEVKIRKENGQYQNAQLLALFAIAKFHAGNIIYSHFEKSIKSSQRIVLTSVEKEHHTFALLISALLCCHHKKHFFYLNSNLPSDSILDAVKATEANTLILSVPSHYSSEREVLSLLDHVMSEINPKVKVWLVGDFNEKEIKIDRWKNTRKFKNYDELDEILSNEL